MTDRDEVPGELTGAYDRVAALRNGAVSGPYGVLLHSPELAEQAAAVGQYVRWNSDLTPAQRETAIMTVARQFDARLMWGAHVRLAREAGVREELIKAIGQRANLGELAENEAAIIRYVRELLHTNRVTNRAFEELRTLLGNRGIVDLTGLIGYYALVGFTLNAFEIEPADGAESLP